MRTCANLVKLEKFYQTHTSIYLLAKIGFDTAENEPANKLQNFANSVILLISVFAYFARLPAGHLWRRSARRPPRSQGHPSRLRRVRGNAVRRPAAGVGLLGPPGPLRFLRCARRRGEVVGLDVPLDANIGDCSVHILQRFKL